MTGEPGRAARAAVSVIPRSRARANAPNQIQLPELPCGAPASDRAAPVWSGKPLEQLSRDDLLACAAHFIEALREMHATNGQLCRRISKMEMAFRPEDIELLNWWLSKHGPSTDVEKGNGEPIWFQWTEFERDSDGLFKERVLCRSYRQWLGRSCAAKPFW
jgi:hypothetical protein